jgi:hypothetical protein
MIRKVTRALAVAAALGSLVACGESDDDDMDDGTGTPSGTTVSATLSEYEVTLSPSSAHNGPVTFSIYNQGSETHEFVVVATALAPGDLPTNADGSFDEEGEGVEVIDEVETIAPGATEELSVTLETGPHVLLCNRVEAEGDELESHFHEGMAAEFSVTSVQ